MEPLGEHCLVPGHDESVVGTGFGQTFAKRKRVASLGQGDIGHRGPHGPLVGVGAAEPAAEEKQLREELLAHLLALRGKGIGRHHSSSIVIDAQISRSTGSWRSRSNSLT